MEIAVNTFNQTLRVFFNRDFFFAKGCVYCSVVGREAQYYASYFSNDEIRKSKQIECIDRR